MRPFIPFLCLALAGILASTGLAAEPAGNAPRSLGNFGAWAAYTYHSKGQSVCYMLLTAHFPAAKKTRRGAAYLMITHRPGEGSRDVVSYTSGYNFKPTSAVKVAVGKKSFDLFMQNDTAWSRDAATDHALAAAIRGNMELKVTGRPADKPGAVTDTIGLKGSDAAYRAIGKACSVEVAPLSAPKKEIKAKPAPKPAVKQQKKKHK